MNRQSFRRLISVTMPAALVASVVFLTSRQVETQTPSATRRPAALSFAQQLVNRTLAAHPETDEIGIAAQAARGCTVIASTDTSDVGEACEEDDAAPIQTGKASVGTEDGEFDVAVPLHDRSGHLVAAVSTRFKKASGQTHASVANQANAIAEEMAKQIPSKAALLAR